MGVTVSVSNFCAEAASAVAFVPKFAFVNAKLLAEWVMPKMQKAARRIVIVNNMDQPTGMQVVL